MTSIVQSLVVRHMKRTSVGAFVRGSVGHALPFLLPTDVVVGVYRNAPPHLDELVIFTLDSIVLTGGAGAVRIGLDRIIGCETPPAKDTADSVVVITCDGRQSIRANGRFGPNGSRRDAYCLLMLLRAIVHRNQKGPDLLRRREWA